MVVVVGWGGDLLKIGRPGSRGWKKFGRRWTEEVGGLPNYTIFMNLIYVLSLIWKNHIDFS